MPEKLYAGIDQTINSKFFITFFDPVRFELVNFLSSYEWLNIGEIAEHFPQDRSVISRHLDQMYQQNILIKEKRSKFIYYQLNCEYITKMFENTSSELRKLMDTCTSNE
jgi:DNA-binding transcriptional ArsR family regulator